MARARSAEATTRNDWDAHLKAMVRAGDATYHERSARKPLPKLVLRRPIQNIGRIIRAAKR